MLDFIGFCLKSPIENEKMLFSGTELSDFAGYSNINKKNLHKGGLFNGARYCANIGLRIMMILKSWNIKLSCL